LPDQRTGAKHSMRELSGTANLLILEKARDRIGAVAPILTLASPLIKTTGAARRVTVNSIST
jgi:hypothetical protein